jgi:hypothetical protein
MSPTITYPVTKESSIPKLKELLKDIIRNKEPLPEECTKEEIQDQCNTLIKTHFIDRKTVNINKQKC